MSIWKKVFPTWDSCAVQHPSDKTWSLEVAFQPPAEVDFNQPDEDPENHDPLDHTLIKLISEKTCFRSSTGKQGHATKKDAEQQIAFLILWTA